MGKVNHKDKPVEQRLNECNQVLAKYPDRLCIYIEKRDRCKTLPDLSKNKYLVPNTITAAQFMFIVRSKLEIPKDCAIFFYINNTIFSGNAEMSTFNKYKAPDGYLYITYTGESCFG